MSCIVQPIGDFRSILGEGVYWSERQACVFWVDIKGCIIYRHNPSNGAIHSWSTPRPIGCIFDNPNKTDSMVGALSDGIYTIRLDEYCPTAELTLICAPEADILSNRFNDGAIDHDGALWVGSMDDAEIQATGAWWKISKTGQAQRLTSGYKVTNGPAFSLDGKWVLFTDSAIGRIYRARYSRDADLRDAEIWLEVPESKGYPDGMAFDARGNIWVAYWDGGCLRCYDIEGLQIGQIDLPVRRPTKIAFHPSGVAYVSSAAIGGSGALDGALLRVEHQLIAPQQ
jgi:xylono-1,5-lactonase